MFADFQLVAESFSSADGNGDGQVTLTELGEYMRKQSGDDIDCQRLAKMYLALYDTTKDGALELEGMKKELKV